MPDLISREAAIEAVKIPDDRCTNISERNGIIFARVEARRAIQDIPAVPAVPLDKLCMLLGDNYGAPCFMTSTDFVHYCEKDNDGNCYFHDKPDEECWKHVLTKWMEGLDAKRDDECTDCERDCTMCGVRFEKEE